MALSSKEETPTYVLPHLYGSEDFTSPAQFHDLGWMDIYVQLITMWILFEDSAECWMLSTESLKKIISQSVFSRGVCGIWKCCAP